MGLTKEKKNCLEVFVEKEKEWVSASRTHRTSQNWGKLKDSNSGNPTLAHLETVEGRHLPPICRTHEIFQHCKINVNLEKGIHTSKTNWEGLFFSTSYILTLLIQFPLFLVILHALFLFFSAVLLNVHVRQTFSQKVTILGDKYF